LTDRAARPRLTAVIQAGFEEDAMQATVQGLLNAGKLHARIEDIKPRGP
jgi:hypothetical protein